ncbi:YgjP-like metallopeptidase domain-containing protein [Archangium violaceum]|uniref:YgjP-like metallopeptidase domain-containing protein n=1 Tax=Archangium violaceum TaxID=83451 RepID=UPI0036DA9BD7
MPPRTTPVERLDAVVQAKAKWSTSCLRLVRPAEPGPSPREFVGGETFLYLGRQYRLEVLQGGAAPVVRPERGRLRGVVSVTAWRGCALLHRRRTPRPHP